MATTVDWSPPSRARIWTALGVAVVIVAISRDDLGGGTWLWAAPATLVTAVLLAWLTPVVRSLVPWGWLPLLIVGITAINYACVPETDQFPSVVVIPLAMATVELATKRQLGSAWSFGAALVVLWAGIYGATGRDSALIGAFFSWWPIAILPIVVGVQAAFARTNVWCRGFVLALGASAAAVVSRTGALQPTAGPALRWVAITAPVSLVLAIGCAAIVTSRGGRQVARP